MPSARGHTGPSSPHAEDTRRRDVAPWPRTRGPSRTWEARTTQLLAADRRREALPAPRRAGLTCCLCCPGSLLPSLRRASEKAPDVASPKEEIHFHHRHLSKQLYPSGPGSSKPCRGRRTPGAQLRTHADCRDLLTVSRRPEPASSYSSQHPPLPGLSYKPLPGWGRRLLPSPCLRIPSPWPGAARLQGCSGEPGCCRAESRPCCGLYLEIKGRDLLRRARASRGRRAGLWG